MTYQEFAKIIRTKRENLGLSQKMAALELGLIPSNYNRIENGKQEPSFLQLQAIARLLDIDLTEVLEIKKPKVHQRMYD